MKMKEIGWGGEPTRPWHPLDPQMLYEHFEILRSERIVRVVIVKLLDLNCSV